MQLIIFRGGIRFSLLIYSLGYAITCFASAHARAFYAVFLSSPACVSRSWSTGYCSSAYAAVDSSTFWCVCVCVTAMWCGGWVGAFFLLKR